MSSPHAATRRALVVVALLSASIAGGCELLAGLSLPEMQDKVASTGAVDACSPQLPEKPSTPTKVGLITFAVQFVAVTPEADAGDLLCANPAIDLDNTNTCFDGGESSCRLFASNSSQACDTPGGGDNGAQGLVSLLFGTSTRPGQD